MPLRNIVKDIVEKTATGLGLAERARRAPHLAGAVLAYHDVVPDGTPLRGDVSLHIPLSLFEAHLDGLLRTHDVVPLAELGPRRGRERPQAAISFDDGYLGTIRHAVPALVTRGLPATIFVCPGLLDQPGFWWDLVASPSGTGLPADLRREALHALEGRQERVLERFPGGHDLPEEYRPARLEELLDAAAQPGITLASHTWSHPNLAALDDSAVRDELETTRQWLAEHVPRGHWTDHLTFPYGLANPSVERVAAATGHSRCYRIEGGVVEDLHLESTPSVLPRINVPSGLSRRGLELRASGLTHR